MAFHLSGGTTECLQVTPKGQTFQVELVARSLDLKAGQAIDRVGVLMGLPFPAGPKLEELALQRSGAAELRFAIENLREPYGQVCRLCLLEERTPEEAALALGRPVKTVHTQLSRGKGLLRKQLTERSEGYGRLPQRRTPDG